MKDIVLITGGLGYIGSHIYLSLIKKDYYPIIIDDLSTSNISVVKSLTKITSKRLSTFFIKLLLDVLGQFLL